MGRGLQQRFESSTLGRVVITAFLIPTLVFIIATNWPESALRDGVMKAGRPYLNATGVDQVWSVFAPDPRRVTIDLEARVQYRDGTATTWHWPRRGPLIGQYLDYRWRKWLESVILDERSDDLWAPAARYIARQSTKPGLQPEKVTLVRRWYELYPPGGPGRHRGVWRHYAYYTLQLETPSDRRAEGK